VLNRLYIVIGVLAILAIGAAFLVPRFIQWGDYRDRMQAISSEVLGAPVEIVGDIEFSLLPQPLLRFGDVRVGDPAKPSIKVAEVEAQFSLIDFLRDRYAITRLVLEGPAVVVSVNADGAIASGISLADKVTDTNVSVANAGVVGGTLTVEDERAGTSFVVSNIAGDLRMDALRGPFAFQGSGDYGGVSYRGRIATSALDSADSGQLSIYAGPADESFTLSAEGALAAGLSPRFAGTMTYRHKPPAGDAAEGEAADVGRGDLVITSKVEASSEKILLSDYTIIPDENRAATRLQGAADITLDENRRFNAVISGGVLALPPRDATADQSALPYELIRLLNELPVAPELGMSGSVGLDIAELNLRAASLRNVRVDATSDGRSWSLKSLSAQLPGNTSLALSGELTADAGRPTFIGEAKLTSARVDGLAALWRKPAQGNPLFNVPATLEARVSVVGETLSLSAATLTLDGQSTPFSAEIGFASATRHLNLNSDLDALTAAESERLLALLPDMTADTRFGVTFPRGQFDLSADAITIAGLDGEDLAAKGMWDGGVLSLDTFGGTLGGVNYEGKFTAFGTIFQPELSGTARLAVASARAPGLIRLFDAVKAPPGVRDWLSRAIPADLAVRIDAPSVESGQEMNVTGRAGAADVTLDARFGVGVMRALGGPMNLRLRMESADPAAFTAQLGLGDGSLVPEGAPMRLTAVIDGTAANSFETTIQIEGSRESLGFSGNVIAGNLEAPSGNGTIKAALGDPSTLTAALGAEGIFLPPLNGTARVDFTGLKDIRLSDIAATAGAERITGALSRVVSDAGAANITGALAVSGFTPNGLLALLAGPAATINSGTGYWPDGPIERVTSPRATTGRIDVTAATVPLGEASDVTDARFAVAWDADEVRIRDFEAKLGGGSVTADLVVCCAGPLPQQQFSGRLTLADVAFSSIVPRSAGAAIGATVNASARFSGAGDSFQSAMAAMTGEGTYTFDGLEVDGFAPGVFGSVASLDEVLDLEPEAVTAKVTAGLSTGKFTAQAVTGSFTIAGGVLRSPNLSIGGDGVRLFGSTTVRLADLGLSGGFAMTPTVPSGPDGMLTEANTKVAANFAGTLPDPVSTYDVAGMVDTIMVRAYEIEVARLELLRAEEEARAAAAAAEKKRLEEEAAAKAAAEKQAAEAKAAAEKAAADKAAAEQAAAEKAAAEKAAAEKAAVEAAEKKAAEEKAAAERAAAQQAPNSGAAASRRRQAPAGVQPRSAATAGLLAIAARPAQDGDANGRGEVIPVALSVDQADEGGKRQAALTRHVFEGRPEFRLQGQTCAVSGEGE
jgi:hypothetical protein